MHQAIYRGQTKGTSGGGPRETEVVDYSDWACLEVENGDGGEVVHVHFAGVSSAELAEVLGLTLQTTRGEKLHAIGLILKGDLTQREKLHRIKGITQEVQSDQEQQ